MSNVLAPSIGSLTVNFAIDDARIMAGADLGADLLPGGTGVNADTYGIGRIGSINVGIAKPFMTYAPITVVATETTDYGWGMIQDSIVGAGLFRSEVLRAIPGAAAATTWLPCTTSACSRTAPASAA